MLSFERFHQSCQAVLAAVSINGLKISEGFREALAINICQAVLFILPYDFSPNVSVLTITLKDCICLNWNGLNSHVGLH